MGEFRMLIEDRLFQLQKNSVIIDGHFDLLMDVDMQRKAGRQRVIETDYLTRFLNGGVNVILAAVYVDSAFLPDHATTKAIEQIKSLYVEITESSDKLMLVQNAADIQLAIETGKIGFLLSLEGAEPIGDNIENLKVFYDLGVRNLGLVWSRRNLVGSGSEFSANRTGSSEGITAFGIELIKEAENLGMMIDVSHLNDQGFWDVFEITKKPIIASHSNCRSLAGTMRNLTDEQIRAIASINGVIGINATNLLTSDDDENSNIENLVNHIEYIVDLVGINHVALGLDLCKDVMKYVDSKDLEKLPRTPFDVIDGHQSLSNLTRELILRGFSDKEIALILGENYLRVFNELLKNNKLIV